MRTRLIQLVTLMGLLLAAGSASPEAGMLAAAAATAILVAVVAVGLQLPFVPAATPARPTADRTYVQPEPAHPTTAGRPQPRAPGEHLQAA